MSTDLEAALVDHVPRNKTGDTSLGKLNLRKTGPSGTYAKISNAPTSHSQAFNAHQILDETPQAYLNHYFLCNLQPSFPIVDESNLAATASGFSQGHAARVAVTTFSLLQRQSEKGLPPQCKGEEVIQLRDTAIEVLHTSLTQPSLSTIQCGLLLCQDPDVVTPTLTSQLVVAGNTLGLSQDCSQWNISAAEKRLRKRLAWALYAQDTWTALSHGCPSLIQPLNWTVKPLGPEEFISETPQSVPPETISHGASVFMQYIDLTLILSDILAAFFTNAAVADLDSAGPGARTSLILSRAKPIQLALKNWFTRLPTPLKMESPTHSPTPFNPLLPSNAPLHLSYFATEITLHRVIIRSLPNPLNPGDSNNYLTHICRAAAKTRLISAMDFLNRLRSEHLNDTFWPFASSMNVALIGSFGNLLRVTSPTFEEAEFYRIRCEELRWTLASSRKLGSKGEGTGMGVGERLFGYAIQGLDAAVEVAGYVPEKPRFVPPAPLLLLRRQVDVEDRHDRKDSGDEEADMDMMDGTSNET